jgi:hypothetical protein
MRDGCKPSRCHTNCRHRDRCGLCGLNGLLKQNFLGGGNAPRRYIHNQFVQFCGLSVPCGLTKTNFFT